MKTKVFKVTDQTKLVPTAKYPYAKFPFTHFNSVQSRVFEAFSEPCNYVIAAATSAGKTVCSELFLAHEVHGKKGKGMYLAPLKALAQEKIDNWTDPEYHFGNLKVAICTGDYRLTADRRKEIDQSNIIIMTSEMLNSKCRNYRSENNQFLANVGTLVVDESHLLTVPGRGDHLESGIMKFTEINPEGRLIFLSATMPNVNEIGEWLSRITDKPTYVLTSNYRPCPLNIHYVKYPDVQWGYDENERIKIIEAIRLLESHPDDKFLLFVHTKRTGDLLATSLKEQGIQCEYHNADLSKDKRLSIEKRFREDKNLRCIVATSTLAWGTNLPARRVVVLGVHRGINEVDTYDIAQMVGRAGRPQYDPQGDAYILLPARSFNKHKKRLEDPQEIKSQILDAKCLAFHLTSEVHHKNIQSMDDVNDWYDRSLANHQNQSLDEDVVNEVMKNLTRCGAMVENQGYYDVTTVGTVASMFYFSPFDVSDLSRNWNKVFERNKQNDDAWIAMALGNIDSQRMNIASSAEKEEMSKFRRALEETNCEKILAGSRDFTDGAVKTGYCYYNLLKGYNNQILGNMMRGLQMDSERLIEVISTVDQMSGKWNQREYFKRLYLRLLYGVEEEMVEICQLKGIGKIKARKLWDSNLRSLESISKNIVGIIKSLNCSKNVAEGICQNAKELLLLQ